MRLGEIKSLSWSNVSENSIRLRGIDAKTKKPRTIVCTGELADLLKRCQRVRNIKTPNGVLMAGTIFHRDGLPVGEFRKSWKTACTKGRLSRKTFSRFAEDRCQELDSRWRSAKRRHANQRPSYGCRRFVAMTFCNEEDLAQAMVSLERYHKAEQLNVVAISK